MRFDAKRAILAACHQACERGELDHADHMRMRRALWLRPLARREVVQLVTTECQACGLVGVDGTYGVDWQAILDFIERLLPILLQLLDIFTEE